MSIKAFDTTYRVRGFDCGYGGPFRPLSLANYFQETAGDHAAVIGIGMTEMFSAGRTWMLSRIDVEAERLPKNGDEVIVRTWPAGTSHLFALRYLCLLSASGDLLAGARYDYLIVDQDKRRPLRPEKIIDSAMVGDLPPPYPDLSPGLQGEAGFEPAELAGRQPSFMVKAYIIDWLCDAVPKEERASGALARLKVDFVAELKQGEEIAALSWKDGAWTKSALMRGGELVARAAIRWARE
jgi:acyl-ACP thioesterase